MQVEKDTVNQVKNKTKEIVEDDNNLKEKAKELFSTPKEEEKSLWGIFILAFLGGFAALLAPGQRMFGRNRAKSAAPPAFWRGYPSP